MFTQIKGINTNKCNGCDKQCTLGALQVTTIDGKQKYLPTKNNEAQIYTKDQHGNNRPLAKAYTTAHDAINAAKLLSHQCDDFTDYRIEKDQLTTPDIDCCIGCKHHCIFSSEIINSSSFNFNLISNLVSCSSDKRKSFTIRCSSIIFFINDKSASKRSSISFSFFVFASFLYVVVTSLKEIVV